MKISYAVTVCLEYKEVERLLQKLLEFKTEESEIVVLVDTGKDFEKSEAASCRDKILNTYKDSCRIVFDKFGGDFANWKNKINWFCKGDFIVQLDADEIPSDNFLKYLPEILDKNPEVDLYFIPRINTVEGITPEDIQRWHWNVNEEGWINFPDYQGRVYRNSLDIKWQGKVHERIVGHKKFSTLPGVFAMRHPKTIDKQRAQNAMYDKMV